jgi:hypothetical protein
VAVADAADELLKKVPGLQGEQGNHQLTQESAQSQDSPKMERPTNELADPHLVLAEPPGVADPVEELAAGRVLHANRQVRRRHHHLQRKIDYDCPRAQKYKDWLQFVPHFLAH